MRLGPSRDGLNVPSYDADFFCSVHYFLRSLAFHSFLGGGGSCRRQWKSAAPVGGRGELVV